MNWPNFNIAMAHRIGRPQDTQREKVERPAWGAEQRIFIKFNIIYGCGL